MDEVAEWLQAGEVQRGVDIYYDSKGHFEAHAYVQGTGQCGYGEGPTMEAAMLEAVRCWARLQCGAV